MGGMMKYVFFVIFLKEFNINNGSYVEWIGNLMDLMFNFKVIECFCVFVGSENG